MDECLGVAALAAEASVDEDGTETAAGRATEEEDDYINKVQADVWSASAISSSTDGGSGPVELHRTLPRLAFPPDQGYRVLTPSTFLELSTFLIPTPHPGLSTLVLG